jgi:hypothetical protein
MKACALHPVASAAGRKSSSARFPHVEKLRDSANSGFEASSNRQAQVPRRDPHARYASSRIETGAMERDWNVSQLSSQFVAQVLGQTMDSPARFESPAAYRSHRFAKTSFLFDKNY